MGEFVFIFYDINNFIDFVSFYFKIFLYYSVFDEDEM